MTAPIKWLWIRRDGKYLEVEIVDGWCFAINSQGKHFCLGKEEDVIKEDRE